MSGSQSSDTWPSPYLIQERGSLRTLEEGKSQFIGSSSGIYFINTVRKAFSAANHDSTLLDGAAPTPEDCIIASDDDENHTHTATTVPSSLSNSHGYGSEIPVELGRPPKPDVAKQLFMIYFQTWHRFFPFLHGPTVLKYMEHLYSASKPALSLPKVIILQSIFNLASLHGENLLPPASSIKKPSDVLSYVPSLTVKGDLVSIQALVASELLLVGRMSLRTAAAVSGLLSRAIFLAGLHRCPRRYSQLSANECDIRKRLFWSIYVLDRYLSQALGHPLGIQDSDVDVCDLTGPELHHPRLQHNTPAGYDGGDSNLTSSSPFPNTIPNSLRSSDEPLGGMSDQDKLSQKHDRHLIMYFQVEYSRLLGRALELFHKSIHIRSINPSSILSLRTDINVWWNALPSNLQEYQSATTIQNQSLLFNESAYFILVHSQLVLLSYRPWLSLEQTAPEFRSALQTCITEAREIINIIKRQRDDGHALFWPGYLSATWMAGIVLAFACHLGHYSLDKGKREISMCLEALFAMSKRWKVAKNCHSVLSDLRQAFETTSPEVRQPVNISRYLANASSQKFAQRDVVEGQLSNDNISRQDSRKRARLDSSTNFLPSSGASLFNSGSTQGRNVGAFERSTTQVNTASADAPTFQFPNQRGMDNSETLAFEGDNLSGWSNWDSGMQDLLAGVTWESLSGSVIQDDSFWNDSYL